MAEIRRPPGRYALRSPPAEICRDGQLEGWRASGPWPIASDLNGSVCNQTCPFNLQDRITVGVSRTSVVPLAPVAKPLGKHGTPFVRRRFGEDVAQGTSPQAASQSGDYCTQGQEKYR